MRIISRITLVLFLCLTAPVLAGPAPAITYQSMLNIYFHDDSGLIRFSDIDLAFAPEGPINAAIAITNSDNTVLKSFKFYPDPRWREGIFARLSEVGPADFQITDPGTYNIVFLLDGQPISRLPVILEQTSAGDDPYNPVEKFRFYGMWQVYSYLTMNTLKDEQFPELNFWLGGRDLPEGQSKEMFQANLKRDGKIVAHSKESQGFYHDGHYQDTRISFYHPHTKREMVNALPYLINDWTGTDGDYSLEIVRRSDNQLVRLFKFSVSGNKIQPLAANQIGFEPHVDFIIPRVMEHGARKYGFVEAIWLKSE